MYTKQTTHQFLGNFAQNLRKHEKIVFRMLKNALKMSPKTGKIRKKSLYITISEKTEMIIDRMCQQATI